MGYYSYHNNKPYVAVPNDVFDRICTVKENIDKGTYGSEENLKTSGLDVVGAFTLYFVFLLRMDWNRAAEIQMKRLIERYFGKVRSETYTAINRYLFILKKAELIDYNNNKYTGSDIICVKVMEVKNKYTLIACVNENFINHYQTIKSNAPFALHCLLSIKRIGKKDKWEPIQIKQDKLADYLNVSKETVRDCIDLLLAKGFIKKSLPQHYTTDDGKVRTYCLLYYVNDYDNPFDNSKIIDINEQRKEKRQNQKDSETILKELLQDFSQTPILLIGDYLKVLNSLSQKDPNIYRKFYNRHTIETPEAAEELMENYHHRELDNDMFLTIELTKHSRYYGDLFLKFIEDNIQLPIVILSEKDDFSAPFLSRMRCCLKKSPIKVRKIRFEPIHKGYQSYEKKNKYYSFNSMVDHAFNNCPELFPPTATNPSGNTTLYHLDNLISKLTGGKTYINILNSAPDPASDVPVETKYLSLLLRRSDLARLSIDEHEVVLQNNIKGISADEY